MNYVNKKILSLYAAFYDSDDNVIGSEFVPSMDDEFKFNLNVPVGTHHMKVDFEYNSSNEMNRSDFDYKQLYKLFDDCIDRFEKAAILKRWMRVKERNISVDEQDVIVKLFEKGNSITSISLMFSRSSTAVRECLKRYYNSFLFSFERPEFSEKIKGKDLRQIQVIAIRENENNEEETDNV